MNLPSVMDLDDVTCLLGEPDVSRWFGRRDALVLALMARCALRVSEVCSLRVDQVRKDDAGVYWLHLRQVKRTVGKAKKTARFRNVPCPPDVGVMLAAWIASDLPKGAVYLVPNRKGVAKLDRVAVWRMVKRYTERAGLDPERVWPHTLRHTALTEMLEAGFDLPEVRDIAGHSSTSVTSIYLHTRPERLAAKMTGWKRDA